LLNFAFNVTGEHPALPRSLLTSATTRATSPDAGAVVEGAVGFGAVGFGVVGLGAVGFGVVGLGAVGFGATGLGGVGLGAVGFWVLGGVVGVRVCTPGRVDSRSHLAASHRRSDSSRSHCRSERAFSHRPWDRLSWLPCGSIQAMAAEGTPTAATARAAMAIFR
jgi:hypothetical protein